MEKKDLGNHKKDLGNYFNIIAGLLGSWIDTTRPDENDLGMGLRLVCIFDVMPKLLEDKKLNDSTNDYSFLFKDGKQVSKLVFRKGGMSNGFKKGMYCNLIVYKNFFNKKAEYRTASTHCIINLDGTIVLEPENNYDYPYYKKGVIASYNSGYYNLLTSELIVVGDSVVDSEEFLFVQKKYNFGKYGKDKPCGVYKITYETGDVEFFK